MCIGVDDVAGKLVSCRGVLSKWSRIKYGAVERDLKNKMAQLANLQLHEVPHNQGIIKELKKDIARILDQEEISWKQRAKQVWYDKGDRNAPYFHAWATQRRKTNRI
jgi:ribosomal protein L29